MIWFLLTLLVALSVGFSEPAHPEDDPFEHDISPPPTESSRSVLLIPADFLHVYNETHFYMERCYRALKNFINVTREEIKDDLDFYLTRDAHNELTLSVTASTRILTAIHTLQHTLTKVIQVFFDLPPDIHSIPVQSNEKGSGVYLTELLRQTTVRIRNVLEQPVDPSTPEPAYVHMRIGDPVPLTELARVVKELTAPGSTCLVSHERLKMCLRHTVETVVHVNPVHAQLRKIPHYDIPTHTTSTSLEVAQVMSTWMFAAVAVVPLAFMLFGRFLYTNTRLRTE